MSWGWEGEMAAKNAKGRKKGVWRMDWCGGRRDGGGGGAGYIALFPGEPG